MILNVDYYFNKAEGKKTHHNHESLIAACWTDCAVIYSQATTPWRPYIPGTHFCIFLRFLPIICHHQLIPWFRAGFCGLRMRNKTKKMTIVVLVMSKDVLQQSPPAPHQYMLSCHQKVEHMVRSRHPESKLGPWPLAKEISCHAETAEPRRSKDQEATVLPSWNPATRLWGSPRNHVERPTWETAEAPIPQPSLSSQPAKANIVVPGRRV